MVRHPIDVDTYKLLVVLTAKLDAVHGREEDESEPAQRREQRQGLKADDQRHADLLVGALRERLDTGSRVRGRTKETTPDAGPKALRRADYTPVWSTDRP